MIKANREREDRNTEEEEEEEKTEERKEEDTKRDGVPESRQALHNKSVRRWDGGVTSRCPSFRLGRSTHLLRIHPQGGRDHAGEKLVVPVYSSGWCRKAD